MENKEPAEYKRLTDKHPTMQKLQKLWELADELGIHIDFYGHRTVVTDDQYPDRIYDMIDLDSPDAAISEFPYAFEVALRFENRFSPTAFCQGFRYCCCKYICGVVSY